jgi:hypothetical protein
VRSGSWRIRISLSGQNKLDHFANQAKVRADRFFQKSYDFQIRRGLALANPAQRSFLLAVRRMPPCPRAPWARKQEIA